MTDTQQGIWMHWTGGVCPVPLGATIDVRYRDGAERYGVRALGQSKDDAGRGVSRFFWRCDGHRHDIVAYRVIAPPQPWRPQPDAPAEVEDVYVRQDAWSPDDNSDLTLAWFQDAAKEARGFGYSWFRMHLSPEYEVKLIEGWKTRPKMAEDQGPPRFFLQRLDQDSPRA